jgi:RNA polymerase sigma-70 factor (ECF subfamily)
MVLRRGPVAVSAGGAVGLEPGDGSDLADLVARAKAHEAEALSLLYRRYLDGVYRFAVARLEDREAAEDATQTIFYQAFASIARCRENAAFAGWLFAIARNVVTDGLRARRRQTAPLDDAQESLDDGPGPDDLVLHDEARRMLRHARETCLSAAERDLFDLLLTELNDKEIAVALGRSHGAVRTAHWRLLGKLRACLDQPLPEREMGRRHV